MKEILDTPLLIIGLFGGIGSLEKDVSLIIVFIFFFMFGVGLEWTIDNKIEAAISELKNIH